MTMYDHLPFKENQFIFLHSYELLNHNLVFYIFYAYIKVVYVLLAKSKKVEDPGIDPGTSRTFVPGSGCTALRSERSAN